MTDWRLSSQVSLARRMARFGIGGYDACTRYLAPPILSAVTSPSFRAAPGRCVSSLAAPEASVDSGDRETLPLHIRARVFGRVAQPLAVAVNGRIVATTRSYRNEGSRCWRP